MTATSTDVDSLLGRVQQLLDEHPPATTDRLEFLRAQYDVGLAWVHFPQGHGGLGLPRLQQLAVDEALRQAGAPTNNPRSIGIGLGMAAPTILAFGNEEQRTRWLRPLWTGEQVWCQLFSEPGAGSDLAALGTRAVREADGWIVNGQKVWTSMAHEADWGILVTRTDPDVPKHRGMTYFGCNMHDPGVEVRPLRQATGEAEFNEVFLTDVRIPDTDRIGEVGDGWRVATGTLMNERVAIGNASAPREGGMLGMVTQAWRDRPEARTPGLHADLMDLWVRAEGTRITGERLRQQMTAGQPGPEGSAAKLMFSDLNQALSGLLLEVLGEDGLAYDDWTMRRPTEVNFSGARSGYSYLRAKGNSIEGGTTEILLNIVAERVLGLPGEVRVDKDQPWKDLPR
jgi:alkylation response protein AidB-like acyl-CoA dehydrogenase